MTMTMKMTMAAKDWAVMYKLQLWVGVEKEERRVLMSLKKSYKWLFNRVGRVHGKRGLSEGKKMLGGSEKMKTSGGFE